MLAANIIFSIPRLYWGELCAKSKILIKFNAYDFGRHGEGGDNIVIIITITIIIIAVAARMILMSDDTLAVIQLSWRCHRKQIPTYIQSNIVYLVD